MNSNCAPNAPETAPAICGKVPAAGASMTIRAGSKLLSLDEPVIMGIVNATPDSFYPGSRTPDADLLRRRVRQVREEGASIIDVGGYSSRPGAEDIPPEEEWRRLDTALGIVREEWPEAVVSVDTFRAGVARLCVGKYGVQIINDIGGGDLDPDMFATVADLGCAYVLMHMRGTPATMQSLTDYADVTAEVITDLAFKADRLRDMGVADIIIDPGFGFAKTIGQNFRLLDELGEFCRMGMPVLAGLSRKSMIWRPLEITPEESLPGTAALNMCALKRGASVLRVHDVREGAEIIKLYKLLCSHSV